MVRVTARQAYTRAKSKKDKKRHELDKAMIEAKNRYIRQLSLANLTVQDENTQQQPKESATHRPGNSRTMKPLQTLRKDTKITDFFATSTKACESRKVWATKKRCSFTSTIDSSGIEMITIDDSSDEGPVCDSNNNTSIKSIESVSSTESITCNYDCQSTSPPLDIKPFHQMGHLGSSFEGLDLSVKVDEDIEIVTMLPPIPLRNHPVFDLDEDEQH